MISSTGNGRIKELVRLKKSAKEREKNGVFLVEGPKMFREIPQGLCREAYVSESFFRTGEGAAAADKLSAEGIEPEIVSDDVFRYLSDTQSPQGILCVAAQMRYAPEELLPEGGNRILRKELLDSLSARGSVTKKAVDQEALIIVLESLQDPGNLGTIIRSAEAAGATGILLSRDCVDIYSPKVTRSTMGSIFRVPFVYTEDLKAGILWLKKQNVRVLAAHLRGSIELYEESFTLPTAILIGNESRGLSDEMAEAADQAIRIPMSGSVESLNAAVAAAVCLFEAKRQRIRRFPKG